MLMPEKFRNMLKKERVVQKMKNTKKWLQVATFLFLKIVWAPMTQRSSDILYVILNEEDGQQKNALTRTWQQNMLANLKRQVITVSRFLSRNDMIGYESDPCSGRACGRRHI